MTVTGNIFFQGKNMEEAEKAIDEAVANFKTGVLDWKAGESPLLLEEVDHRPDNRYSLTAIKSENIIELED